MSPLAATLAYQSPIPPLFHWPLHFGTGVTGACYVLSVLTGNVSQVDRVWTFLPVIYTAYFALAPFVPHKAHGYFWPYVPEDTPQAFTTDVSPRALMMLGLQTIWMLRLSYNTWRRGLFNLHDEDYRWQVLRDKLPSWLFHVTNLVFIAFAQNVILFLLGVPAAIAAAQPHAPLSASDYTLGALSLLTLLTEFIADNQQYAFQAFKRDGAAAAAKVAWPGARIKWTDADAKRGFVTRGLWAWSRHPNFLCEQTFWVLQNLTPLLAPQPPTLKLARHLPTSLWPLAPALVLCALFRASTSFSEGISASKYPRAYGAYQRRVAMFMPPLTPLWGALLHVQGQKAEVDELVWGEEVEKLT